MVGDLKAGLLAHHLHLADDLPHEALLDQLGRQDRINGNGDIPVGYGIEALPLGGLNQQVGGGQLHRPFAEIKAQLALGVQLGLGGAPVQGRQRLANLAQLLAVFGANGLQLRLKVIADKVLHLFGEYDFLDVQLLPDNFHIEAVQVLIRLDIHDAERLAVLAVGAVAGGAAQLHNADDLIHLGFQLPVDPLRMAFGEVAQMDAFRRRLINAAHQVLVDRLADERHHGGGRLGNGHQGGIQRHIGGNLVLLHAGRPVAFPPAADVPVAHILHKGLQRLGGLRDAVIVQMVIHRLHRTGKAGKQPAVHYRQVRRIQGVFCCVKAVNIGIQHKEGVGIPQRPDKLALTLNHCLAVEAVGQPRGGIDIEIPADGVSAVGLQRLKGIHRVALGFAHLLPVFILHVSQHNDVFEAGTVKHQGRDGVQRIEPAAGLIHRLADEIRRELLLEQLLVFEGIVVLGKGHRAGIEPAVNHLGDAVHLPAALGAADGDSIDKRTMQLNVLGAVVAHLPQLGNGAYGMAFPAFALPDVEGCTPVAVAAQAPVLDILQPIAKAALSDALRDPVDGIVVADQIVLHRRHLDKPGLAGIIQQRGIAPPAEGIVVFKLGCIIQQAPAFQVHQYLRVGILYKEAGKGGFLGHMALAIYKLYKGQIVAAAYLGVVLTKGRRDMNDTGTITHGDIVSAGHIKALFLLLFSTLCRAGKKRLIFLVSQRLAGHLLQHLVGGGILGLQFAQYGIQQRLGQIIGISVGRLDLAVGILRIDAQRHIAGQRPGGGRPRQEVGVLALHLKAHNGTALLDCFIALRHLVAGKRRSAAGAVWHNLKALVQKPPLVDALQRPPFAFDIVVVIGDIGVLHIRPEAHGTGKLLPHPLVLPDAFLAVLYKGLQAVFLNLILAVQAQLFFHFQLHRQAVGIPTGLAGHHIALHGAVARDHILDDAGQHVPDMGLAVGGRGTVVKDIGRPLAAGFDAFLKDMLLLPEGLDLLFLLHKINIGRDALVHPDLLLSE